MPKLTVVQKQEVKILPKLTQKLLTDLRIYADMHQQIKVLDEQKRISAEAILQNGIEVGEERFELEGFKVKLVLDGTKKKLDQGKLVKQLALKTKLSVKAIQAIIEACTAETPTKPYAKVTVPGGKEEREDAA